MRGAGHKAGIFDGVAASHYLDLGEPMANELPIIEGDDALLILQALQTMHRKVGSPLPEKDAATDATLRAIDMLYARLCNSFAFELTDDPRSWLDKALWHERDEMAQRTLNKLRLVLADRAMTRPKVQEAMRRFVIDCRDGGRLYKKPKPYPWGGTGSSGL